MNLRAFVLTICVIACAMTPTLAQPTPAPAQAPRVVAPAPRPGAEQTVPAPTTIAVTPRRQGQPLNVKVDFVITDQRGGSAAIKRTLTLIIADEHTGSIRSQSNVYLVGDVPLNVDASPSLLAEGKIRLGFNLQYDWPAPTEGLPTNPASGLPRGTVIKTALHDSVSLILESGKPVVAAQSADPIGDRQVTVEVKATILR